MQPEIPHMHRLYFTERAKMQLELGEEIQACAISAPQSGRGFGLPSRKAQSQPRKAVPGRRDAFEGVPADPGRPSKRAAGGLCRADRRSDRRWRRGPPGRYRRPPRRRTADGREGAAAPDSRGARGAEAVSRRVPDRTRPTARRREPAAPRDCPGIPDSLGVAPETARIDAEGIEHHVSEETLAAFRHAMAGNKRR